MTKIAPFVLGLLGGAVASISYYSEGNLIRVAGNILTFTVFSYLVWRYRNKNKGQ